MSIPPRLRAPAALAAGALLLLATALAMRTPAPPPPTPVATLATPPVCPESVTLDDRGDPRNAAGRIRQCWPGTAKCHCDRDRDCYALEGYRPCTPRPQSTRPDAGPSRRDVPVGAVDAVVPRDAGRAVDVGAPRVDAGARLDAGPSVVLPLPSGLRAFPGAEGWGAGATGGRGGRVVAVTTLAASGPGSLSDALAQSGPRTIVFRVSGVIAGEAQILHGDVTVAGQTSPGGITVRGLHTTEEPYCDQACGARARGVENFVVRFLRSRPAGAEFPDGLRLRYVRRGIVDHCSMGNAADEAVEISYAHDLTIQDSLLAETIGGHAQYGGMLINYTNPAAGYALDNLTLVRNVWNRLQGRYPELSRESAGVAAGTTLHLELTNNLYWDQRFYTNLEATDVSGDDQGRPIHYQVNRVGNVSRTAPSMPFGQVWMRSRASGTTAYFADNRTSRWPTLSDWQLNYCCNDFSVANAGARPAWARTERHPFPSVTVLPSSAVVAYAVAHAGAFPRDPMDRRLMDFVARGVIDPRPSDRNPVGDALLPAFSGAPPAPPADADGDGMPDDWERAHGLDATRPDHNGLGLSRALTGVEGYTNLEGYLHELALQRVREGR
jgi:pectate lyase